MTVLQQHVRGALFACAYAFAFLMVLAVAAAPALASIEPDEVLADPVLEERAREIGRELRCVTCQSQSIEDSAAPLAKDLRRLVRERLVAGDSDDEIVAHVTERYGDYVRLRPRISVGTIFLWGAPLLALGLGGLALAAFFRGMPDDDEENDPAPETDEY
ncbi:MAG: cytochrome c-type biogenesis protein [Pseudomonadota bacterium]